MVFIRVRDELDGNASGTSWHATRRALEWDHSPFERRSGPSAEGGGFCRCSLSGVTEKTPVREQKGKAGVSPGLSSKPQSLI